MTVDKANLRSLEELLRIERECFTIEAFTKKQVETLLGNPKAISLLVRIDGDVAGFIIGLIEKHGKINAGHVYTIDVAVKHRRRGAGIRLLKEMENAFLRKGAETSYLEVRVDNQAARKLYKKHGYIEIEPLNDFYFPGIHGLKLMKQLRPRRSASASL